MRVAIGAFDLLTAFVHVGSTRRAFYSRITALLYCQGLFFLQVQELMGLKPATRSSTGWIFYNVQDYNHSEDNPHDEQR
jgi:hypothetical protein